MIVSLGVKMFGLSLDAAFAHRFYRSFAGRTCEKVVIEGLPVSSGLT